MAQVTDRQTSHYNSIERALHRLVFATPGIQRLLAEMESDLYRHALDTVTPGRPVFITALPRAGTTLLLELLHQTGEFVSATYRQMPFVQTPLFWQGLSALFRRRQTPQERAHGDGMLISVDSPEAFEEVLWLAMLKDKIVHRHCLQPLGRHDITPEARRALDCWIRKLLLLAGQNASRPRYLSKNNANIARIKAIGALYPDAVILVPFRHPLRHVQSLHHQHRGFLKRHREDPFARTYMRGIGHYDFGDNFKPINFGDNYGAATDRHRIDQAFWLDYWQSAYEHALAETNQRVHFIDFDRLLDDGHSSLATLAALTGLKDPARLTAQATRLRAPTSPAWTPPAALEPQVDTALSLYRQLQARAANAGCLQPQPVRQPA